MIWYIIRAMANCWKCRIWGVHWNVMNQFHESWKKLKRYIFTCYFQDYHHFGDAVGISGKKVNNLSVDALASSGLQKHWSWLCWIVSILVGACQFTYTWRHFQMRHAMKYFVCGILVHEFIGLSLYTPLTPFLWYRRWVWPQLTWSPFRDKTRYSLCMALDPRP